MKMNRQGLPIIDRPVIPPDWLCIDRYRDDSSKREREKDYGISVDSTVRGTGKGFPGMDNRERNIKGLSRG